MTTKGINRYLKHIFSEPKVHESHSSSTFKQLFNSQQVVMLLTDPSSGKIEDANEAAAKFYQYSISELCQFNISQLCKLPKLLVNELQQRANAQSQNYFVFPHQLASGELRTVEVHSSPILLNGEQLLLSIVHDITSYVKAENQRLEYENKYHLLFDNLTTGFAVHEIICDSTGKPINYRYIEANPSFEKLTGINREKLIGKTVLDIFPKTESYWIKEFGRVALTGQTRYFENYSCELNAYFGVLAFSPEKFQFAIIVSDITESKMKERELKEHEEQLRKIFEHTHSVLLLLNEHTEIIKINQAGLVLAETTNLELLNQQPGNLLQCVNSIKDPLGCGYSNECLNCRFREILTESMLSHKEHHNEEIIYTQITDNGLREKYLQVSTSLINMANKRHLLMSIENITQRKRMELELIEAKNKAEEGDKLKTAFFNNLSHEIRTPLNGILGFSGLLKRCDMATPEMSLFSSYIQDNSNRLLQIMNSVIELAQINSGIFNIRHTDIDLAELLKKTIEEQSQVYNKREIPINHTIKGFPKIKSDPKIIQSILDQLINNSIKFTTQGRIEIRITVHKDALIGIIADTGIGIDLRHQHNILNPFVQVEDTMTKSYGGLGLGLAIVNGYIDKLNGSITIKSQMQKGTVIRFCIPVMAITQSTDAQTTTNIKSQLENINHFLRN
jgi:PAS domain S-box-containing protein